MFFSHFKDKNFYQLLRIIYIYAVLEAIIMVAFLYAKHSEFGGSLMNSIVQFLIILGISNIFFLSIFFFFKHQLKYYLNNYSIKYIEKLERDNKMLIEKNNLLTGSYHHYKNLVKIEEISSFRKEKLISDICSKITTSLAEIKEFIRIFIQLKTGEIKISISRDKQLDIFIEINNKLAYLSEFCVAYQEEDIEILDIVYNIREIYEIYKKDIVQSRLNVIPTISTNIKNIKFNKLLLQQILASLLNHAVSHARPAGTINIDITTRKKDQQDTLVILIKDNGFYLSEEFTRDFKSNFLNISPLELDLNTIKNILETHNGTLDLLHGSENREIYLTLPCETFIDVSKTRAVEHENVILFRKPLRC